MERPIRTAGLAIVLAAAASCTDAVPTGPSYTAAFRRYQSVLDDSVSVQHDAVQLVLPAATRWHLAISGAGMDTALVDSGRGTSWIGWRRNLTTLLPGTHVDTLTLTLSDGGAPVVWLDSVVIRSNPAPFVTARRAWLPGERDSVAKSLRADGIDPSVLLDSAVVIVPNPLYHPAVRNFPNLVMNPTVAGMTLVGLDLFFVDSSTAPVLDTTNAWLEAFWYSTTTPTYKGYTVVYSVASTIGPQQLSNSKWDASYGTSGGGGGEINPSTGEYWEVTSGSMQVTANTARGAAGTTLASGPYTGGVQRNGTMSGRQQNVTLTRNTPLPATTQNWTLDFRTTPIPAARIECIWYGTPVLNVNPSCHP